MKRLFAIFIAILALSSVVFAQTPTLPDYQKDGKLTDTYLCDSGKTTMKAYRHDKWQAEETRTSSGAVFVESTLGLYMQAAGSKEMKKVSHQEWDKALAEASRSAFNELHDGQSDCKRTDKK